jgi:hypothetical protein
MGNQSCVLECLCNLTKGVPQTPECLPDKRYVNLTDDRLTVCQTDDLSMVWP